MKRYGIWRTLELDPTRDRAEIRRAYARRLKVTSPEDDAAAFQALREAYEQALHHADNAWDDEPAADLEPDAPEPAFAETVFAEADAELAAAPRQTPFEPPPLAEPSEADRQRAAITQLAGMIEQGAAPADLRKALAAILTSPAMDILAVYDHTEQALSTLAGSSFPRSDPLVLPLIQHFRWDDRTLRRGGYWIGAILARNADLEVLARVHNPGHTHHAAYKALTNPPRKRPFWWPGPGADLRAKVAELLHSIQENYPGLVANLDETAVAWWTAELQRERMSAAGRWAIGLGPALAALVLMRWAPTRDLIAFPLLYLALLALLLGGMIWPRRLWRARFAATALNWQVWGWAVGAPLVLLFSAALPARPAAGGLLGAFALATGLWSIVTSPPAGAAAGAGGPLEALTQDRRRRRTPVWAELFGLTPLVVWWLLVQTGLGPQRWVQMTPAVLALAVAVFFAAGPVQTLWQAAPERRRLAGLLAGLGLVAAAGALLGGAIAFPPLAPLAAVAVALGIAVPPLLVDARENVVRSVSTLVAGMAAALIAFKPLGFTGITAAALLSGAAAALLAVLGREHFPTRRKKKR